jgi:hypothetical protein
MNVDLAAPRGKWPGRLVNLAVVIIVLALAAATFMLSYSGVRAIAVQAGVSAQLARLYPGIFDAVFVIACVAVIALRDARWWTRAYAWLVIIVVVGVVGTADVVHAMNVALPHRKTEAVVAAAPWVLVLLGFSLMLIMLRQSRAPHADVTPAPATEPALVQAADHRPAALAPAEIPTREEVSVPESTPIREDPTAPEPTSAQAESAHREPVPTVEEPVLREPPPTVEQPAAPEADPALPEPEHRELAPTRAEPVVAGVAAPKLDADPDATRETASIDGHEPVPTWQGPALRQSPERGPVDSGLVAPPRGFWGTDAEDGPSGADQDVPPFATVPRLNRVRATPVPPENKED